MSFSALLRAENSERPRTAARIVVGAAFQCSSASRKFGKATWRVTRKTATRVSVLFCEPKIRKAAVCAAGSCVAIVSVLFCEPKIRKAHLHASARSCVAPFQCSSASRKFGKCTSSRAPPRQAMFQCSSASRKFGKFVQCVHGETPWYGFSALLRAENSESEARICDDLARASSFQCSSASRKFGKSAASDNRAITGVFQCSSASRKFGKSSDADRKSLYQDVSVLFCEPKIRKPTSHAARDGKSARFSALLRAENSETKLYQDTPSLQLFVSVLFCEPKIRKGAQYHHERRLDQVSVLFCEPKIRKR